MIRTITPAYNVTAVLATQFPCNLINLQGYFRGAADKWLQIHDTGAVPADTTVPLKSFQLPALLAFSWKFDPSDLEIETGLYVCISDTEATKTLSASTADIFIDIDEFEVESKELGLTSVDVGDLTTGVDALQVRADSVNNSAKRLVRLRYTNNDAQARYLMLFASDNPANGDYPIASWKAVAAQQLDLRFGNGGNPVRSGQEGSVHYGISFFQSSTPKILTKTTSVASYMKGTYV